MIRELDAVVLTKDVSEAGLMRGNTGAVVYCYGGWVKDLKP